MVDNSGKRHRPPAQRATRIPDDAELARITTNRLHLSALSEMDEDAWALVGVLMDVEQFKSRVLSHPDSVGTRSPISRMMLRFAKSIQEFGVAEETSADMLKFMMPAFVITKKTGGLRMILDCRLLNEKCNTNHRQ